MSKKDPPFKGHPLDVPWDMLHTNLPDETRKNNQLMRVLEEIEAELEAAFLAKGHKGDHDKEKAYHDLRTFLHKKTPLKFTDEAQDEYIEQCTIALETAAKDQRRHKHMEGFPMVLWELLHEQLPETLRHDSAHMKELRMIEKELEIAFKSNDTPETRTPREASLLEMMREFISNHADEPFTGKRLDDYVTQCTEGLEDGRKGVHYAPTNYKVTAFEFVNDQKKFPPEFSRN